MPSFAQRHHDRVLAARQSLASDAPAGEASGGRPAATPLATRMLQLLAGHRAALKAIKSRDKKIALKAEVIGEYDAYVEGVLEAATGAQDTVLVTIMLWRLDIRDFAGAAPLIRYALAHDMAMPEGFSRDLPEMVLEEIAESVLKDSEDLDLEQTAILLEVIDLTDDIDMHDEIRAKAHKAAGLLHVEQAPERAIEHYEEALRLNPNAGVKQALDRLRRETDRPEDPAPPAAAARDGEVTDREAGDDPRSPAAAPSSDAPSTSKTDAPAGADN